jgi:hypothetical protein
MPSEGQHTPKEIDIKMMSDVKLRSDVVQF